jgi:hypothetical protein
MSNFKSTKTDGSESLFGEVIFSYTRAQAIADRALIDVTPTAAEVGFRFPAAVTSDLMAAIETIPQKYSHEDTLKAGCGTLCRARHKGRALDRIAFRAESETRLLSHCL